MNKNRSRRKAKSIADKIKNPLARSLYIRLTEGQLEDLAARARRGGHSPESRAANHEIRARRKRNSPEGGA